MQTSTTAGILLVEEIFQSSVQLANGQAVFLVQDAIQIRGIVSDKVTGTFWPTRVESDIVCARRAPFCSFC